VFIIKKKEVTTDFIALATPTTQIKKSKKYESSLLLIMHHPIHRCPAGINGNCATGPVVLPDAGVLQKTLRGENENQTF
jgi:hypothetical protein